MYFASRRPKLAPEVIFVDGLSGAGKTALLTTLSSLEYIEMVRFEHIYEYACALNYLKRIEDDAATSLIRIHIDLACYNSMISRHVNFRPSDISSVIRSPKVSKYLERLFLSDGENVISRIKTERTILHIMTHQLLGISKPIFNSLMDRFVFIEIVRHPLFLIPAWHSYIDRYGKDPLEMTICIDFQGRDIPWFAATWGKNYIRSNKMDRIIRSIEFLTNQKTEYLKHMSNRELKKILVVPFEKFVIDPWPVIKQLERLLSIKHTDATANVLKKQNIPRKSHLEVPDLADCRKYGYSPLEKETNEEAEIKKLWVFVKKEASAAGLTILEQLSAQYEEDYLYGF